VVVRSTALSLLSASPERCPCGPITAVQGTITAPPLLVLRLTVKVTASPSFTSPVPAGRVRATETMLGSLALMVTLGVPLAVSPPAVDTAPSVSVTGSSGSLSISSARLRVMVPLYVVGRGSAVETGMVRVPPVAVAPMPVGAVMS